MGRSLWQLTLTKVPTGSIHGGDGNATQFFLLLCRMGGERCCLQRVGFGAGLLGFGGLADSGYGSLLNWHAGDILSSRFREGLLVLKMPQRKVRPDCARVGLLVTRQRPKMIGQCIDSSRSRPLISREREPS